MCSNSYIGICLMEKYNVTSKGKKTLFCTYYNATNTLSNTEHTIQKLSRRQDWSEVLAKKDILLMKQNQLDCLPSIVEAVQEEGKFFIVLTNQLGANVDDLKKRKLEAQEIVMIGIKILESIQKLNHSGVEFYDIRPEFFFWNNSTIKVTYAPTKQESFLKSISGQLADIRHHSPQTVLEGLLDQRSSIFSTGLLLVELICGQTLIAGKNKLDYIYSLAQLFPKEHQKTGQTLESKLLRHCSKDLTDLLVSMMNPERQKRLGLIESIQGLQKADLTFVPSTSNINQKSKSLISSKSVQVNSIKSPISHNQPPPEQVQEVQPRIQQIQQVLSPILKPKDVLQEIKTTSISFNFNIPPESPPIQELVQQLKIITILNKQTNTADDVAISTIITDTRKSELSYFEELEIPQETVAPQLTVFAKQENDEEDIFNIPGFSEEDDNGLFEII